MGYFDKEMEEMLDVYLMETEQLLDQADAILSESEQSQSLSPENINGIFRIMHTMKSSSAMMGLKNLSNLAHRLEDVFSLFREDASRLKGFEKDSFELIFEATEFIRTELEQMRSDNFIPRSAAGLESKIEEFVLRLKSRKSLTVNLRFEKDCKMEHIRAFMVARQIRNQCTNLNIYPEDVESNPGTADYIRENGFYLNFIADDPGDVLERLSHALFVESCRLVEEMPGKENGEKKAVSAVHAENDFIHVKVEKLDLLQSLTEELLIASSAARRNEMQKNKIGDDTSDRLFERCLKELESLVISIRMVPFAGVVPKLNRVVRDICKKERKETAFSVKGQDAEVDKAIADGMTDALIHLIRNALDHGIESPELRESLGKSRAGSVELRFENLGGEILITIEDDGAGMDLDKIRQRAEEKGLFSKPADEYSEEELLALCFLPGFSTRDAATEFSGRGVGMDVVYQTVEGFGGHIRLESSKGKGSRILIHLPLTLTLIDGIRFQAGGYYFVLPSYQVRQFFPYRKDGAGLATRNGRQFYIYEGKYIPVLHLREFYHCQGGDEYGESLMAYVCGVEREACLIIDRVMEQGSIVEKPLPAMFGKNFKYETGISGCSVFGDGSICMMLDIEALIQVAAKGEKDR